MIPKWENFARYYQELNRNEGPCSRWLRLLAGEPSAGLRGEDEAHNNALAETVPG